MKAFPRNWGQCCELGFGDLVQHFPCNLPGGLSPAQLTSNKHKQHHMFPLKPQRRPGGIHRDDLDPFLSITHKVADRLHLQSGFFAGEIKVTYYSLPWVNCWHSVSVWSIFFLLLLFFVSLFVFCFLFAFVFLLNPETVEAPENEASCCSVNWWSLISHGAETSPIASHNFPSPAISLDLKQAFHLFVLLP